MKNAQRFAGLLGVSFATLAFGQILIPPSVVREEAGSVEDSPPSNELTPGYVLIEGDIQVPREERDARINHVPNAVFGDVTYWGPIVYWDYVQTGDGALSGSNIAQARAAMREISTIAGVTFVLRENAEPDWIRFQRSNYNNSPVGKRGGMQIVNILDWNYRYIIIHELFHSLGFWHEQAAPDRDDYVTILYENICTCCEDQSCAFNFDIAPGASTYGPYDFDSVMHYQRDAFSVATGVNTIWVNEPWHLQWQNQIGHYDHLSVLDRLSCRGLYPFPNDRWLHWTGMGTGAGTFSNPYNSVSTAVSDAPSGATLLTEPGNYPFSGRMNRPMTIRATWGNASIGR